MNLKNQPLKRQEKRKAKSRYTGIVYRQCVIIDKLNMLRHRQVEVKVQEKDTPGKTKQKKASLAILVTDTIDFMP